MSLALAVGSATRTSAATDTVQVGRQGGTAFEAICPPGEIVVGFAYASGTGLSSIGAICAAVQGTSIGADGHIAGDIVGPSDGKSQNPVVCAPNAAIERFSISLDKGLQVHDVKATCHSIAEDTGPVLMKTTATTPGDDAITKAGAYCHDGMWAVGITGGFDTQISRLGLRCATLDQITAAATPEAPPPPPDTDLSMPQDDTGAPPPPDKPKHSAQIRTAEEPTTIYSKPAGKEIAYLAVGDEVTIIGCEHEGQGWCRISKPKKGFVWGGDLGP